jgi:TolA-binding protein
MKMKWTALALSLMFTGALMADQTAIGATAAATKPAAHRKTKKKKKTTHATRARPIVAPPTASSATSAAAPAAKPEPAKIDTFQAWLMGMKKRLTQSDTRSNKLVAVAAVRGDETADAAPLYWKGGKKADVKNAVPEQKDFEAAIDTALRGDKLGAKDQLQSFLIAYPKSPLASDAQETLTRLEAN